MQKKWIKRILFIGALLYVLIKIYQIYFYIPDLNFCELKLKTLDNKNINSEILVKDRSIIVFFQTWCGPCIAEMKIIQKHYSEFQFTNIYFISDEPIEKLNGLKLRLRLDSLNIIHSDNKLENIGIQAFPTIYVLKNNKILETYKGALIDESNWEDEIFHLKKLLQTQN